MARALNITPSLFFPLSIRDGLGNQGRITISRQVSEVKENPNEDLL